jgi:hypothetical protein
MDIPRQNEPCLAVTRLRYIDPDRAGGRGLKRQLNSLVAQDTRLARKVRKIAQSLILFIVAVV